jgi:hypothetical protein
MKTDSKSQKVPTTERPIEITRLSLSSDDLRILKAPFPKERLGVKVQNFNKDRSRAMLVLYLQHTDVQDRLEEVDPAWTTEVLHEQRMDDSVYVRLRLTLKGVTRENVGEGSDPKGAYSDALKRCAMLFGVGRYLYDSDTIWVDYDDSRDRYRQWSIEDYDRVARGTSREPSPGLKTSGGPTVVQTPKAESKSEGKSEGKIRESKKVGTARPREQLNRILMNMYRPYLTRFPETKFVDLLNTRYGVAETRLMTVEQMEDLIRFMETQLQSVA